MQALRLMGAHWLCHYVGATLPADGPILDLNPDYVPNEPTQGAPAAEAVVEPAAAKVCNMPDASSLLHLSSNQHPVQFSMRCAVQVPHCAEEQYSV